MQNDESYTPCPHIRYDILSWFMYQICQNLWLNGIIFHTSLQFIFIIFFTEFVTPCAMMTNINIISVRKCWADNSVYLNLFAVKMSPKCSIPGNMFALHIVLLSNKYILTSTVPCSFIATQYWFMWVDEAYHRHSWRSCDGLLMVMWGHVVYLRIPLYIIIMITMTIVRLINCLITSWIFKKIFIKSESRCLKLRYANQSRVCLPKG